jgi:capsular exopolysaccharide synthesis family protein
VSRIFDALRKYEQERAAKQPGAVGEGKTHWPELLDSLDRAEVDLSAVPRVTCVPDEQEHVIVARNGRNSACERFRLLRHKLQQMSQTRAMKKVLITSTSPQEGKTAVAVNLAATFALSSARSLLIEGDMRNPGVARLLKVQPNPGLADVLENRCSLGTALRYVDPLGVYYLAAGKATRNPVELLQSPKMNEVISEAAQVFEWVVLDSPPLKLFADAHCLATISDAVLLVVRMGQTTPEALEEGVRILADTSLTGIVLNGVEDRKVDSYYTYYSKGLRHTNKNQDPGQTGQTTPEKVGKRD